MDYLVNGSTDPHWNMAFDEWCLEHLDAAEPVFYLWRNRPSVIIGLNQNAYSEVNLNYLESNGITLARRVTGGGAVYHDLQNLNYTFIGRSVDTAPFVEALRSVGVPAEVTGRNDVFVDGRKISGYAKRVWKDRTMVHGTLMYDVDIDTLSSVLSVPGSKMEVKGIASVRSRVCNLREICPQFSSVLEVKEALQAFLEQYGGGGRRIVLSGPQLSEITSLCESKFATWEWNYGRSREASIVRSGKLPCGTVEARLDVDGGIIRSAAFTGDFLGRLSPDGLAEALAGLRYDRKEIEKAVSSLEIGNYLDGTGRDEFVHLLI